MSNNLKFKIGDKVLIKRVRADIKGNIRWVKAEQVEGKVGTIVGHNVWIGWPYNIYVNSAYHNIGAFEDDFILVSGTPQTDKIVDILGI